MIKKVKQTIEKFDLLKKGERVVVAVSGGPDSTACLTVLASIAGDMDLELIVAHFNHGLRGKESDRDEQFARRLAKKLGLVFYAGKLNKKIRVKGISPEDFYRRQRYAFLEKTAAKHRAQKIALGQHLNDQAETVLLNLLRGSGLEGLKGFLPIREGRIIRPLIEVSAQEIISFLEQSGMAYCRDSSNESSQYLRNQIRAELIPFLKGKYNPRIEENLAQMAEILRREDDFIRQHAAAAAKKTMQQKKAGSVALNIHAVKKIPEAIRWRLLKMLLEDLTPSGDGISFLHVNAVNDLTQKNASGKKITLPAGIEARREYDQLILEKKRTRPKKNQYAYVMSVPGTVHVKERGLTIKATLVKKIKTDLSRMKNTACLDWSKIAPPLVVRNRRDGDWIQPLGMRGRQKIKKYFIDHKIPVAQRDDLLLLVDRLSVVYIEHRHISDRVKISPATKSVLKLAITPDRPVGKGSKPPG
ncbi:MAG TPA: tRNA lysidine(34) synthetase TilS [Smithella sp.]|jgi:tRNA(Ile)-lysidine synthase|nr:tRNA lysidine(34) synthetase TilS [Smithella sp.]HNQ65535.1 tRNA lysidine(34) synthetase TilS [Smithella sp.]HOE32236.1 tRNA lysidine(34) synthetase TilS [Smithella sp.]HOG10523.1 tRNA lysidine(34) synthetase TilS [Smithella sp.]HOO35428.1 tRNA lysidine(34) synthetase TilS [Smithella sp.]